MLHLICLKIHPIPGRFGAVWVVTLQQSEVRPDWRISQ